MDFSYTAPSFPSLNGYPESQFHNHPPFQVQRPSMPPARFGTDDLNDVDFTFLNNRYIRPTMPEIDTGYMADGAGGAVWESAATICHSPYTSYIDSPPDYSPPSNPVEGCTMPMNSGLCHPERVPGFLSDHIQFIHYNHKPNDNNPTGPSYPQFGFTARNHIPHEFVQGSSTRNEPLSAAETPGPKQKKQKIIQPEGFVHKPHYSEGKDEHGKKRYFCTWKGLNCKYSSDRISEMKRHHRGASHAAEKSFCCSKYACPCKQNKMFSRNDSTRAHAKRCYVAAGLALPQSLAPQRQKSSTGNIHATVQEEDTP